MPMVWTDGELAEMADSLPDIRIPCEEERNQPPGTWNLFSHSLRVYARHWNDTNEYRQHCRVHHPDIYGAMMAHPLRECAQFIGDEAAGHIIAWRMAHRR